MIHFLKKGENQIKSEIASGQHKPPAPPRQPPPARGGCRCCPRHAELQELTEQHLSSSIILLDTGRPELSCRGLRNATTSSVTRCRAVSAGACAPGGPLVILTTHMAPPRKTEAALCEEIRPRQTPAPQGRCEAG